MYSLRLWSSRHARLMERLYTAFSPPLVTLLRVTRRLTGGRADALVTYIEATTKGFMFDCKMCGNCVLSRTGMTCPMNCPKTMRNGPCGGVRENGMCEVNPLMRCVWVEAWSGAAQMKNSAAIGEIEFAVDHRLTGSSAWLGLARND